MKITSMLLFSASVLAAPVSEKRQAKEAGGGPCTVGFVFARGSTEPSPLGILIGPSLQSALRAKVPGLKTFPVLYAASLSTNMSPQRTDATSIAKGNAAFKQAANCKTILAGGYSQGAAVMHNVVGKLDADLKGKVVGVALFGSTRNKQDNGHIPNLPEERSKTWCNKNDGVCGGGLNVNAGHMSYNKGQINEAATWLAQRAGNKNAGAMPSSESADSAAPATATKGAKGAKGAAGSTTAKGAGMPKDAGAAGHEHWIMGFEP